MSGSDFSALDALEAAYAAAGSDDAGASEKKRRTKAERRMALRPDDGRRVKHKGARKQFNTRVREDLLEAMFKAATRAGMPVTEWIEDAIRAKLGKGHAA